jgi:hypothetical protein
VTVSPVAAPAPPADTNRRGAIDHGAVVAAWVGLGMAITIGVSFLLVIPIEPIYWLLSPLAGLLIGYYANQRALTPRRAWRRVLPNGLFAGLITGVTLALLLLAVKGLFFYADTGFPDFNRVDKQNQPIPPYCQTGGPCVYARYLAAGRGPALAAAGVTEVGSFSALYWQQQLTTAGLLLGLSLGASAIGGAVYAVTRSPGD